MDIGAVQPGVWIIRYNYIHFPLGNQIRTIWRGCVGDLDGNLWELFMELFKVRDQKVTADGIAGSNVELSQPQKAGIHNLMLPTFNQVDSRLNVL